MSKLFLLFAQLMPCWKINRVASFSEILYQSAFLTKSLTLSRNYNVSSLFCFRPNNFNLLSHIGNLFLDIVLIIVTRFGYFNVTTIGVAFCVWDAREAKQCHDECFPGLGGEMLCLYDDLGEIDDVGLETNGDRDVDDHVPLSTGSNQVNTRASASRAVVLAEEILGLELLDPLPHQVGSTPGGVKPPSPDNIQHR